ncbi:MULTISPECIES: EutP/PduV family microcompartment system protein [Clostridium]|uniref:Ethanolamine utilization protein EutP n=1 Tax=Clostridium cadaveris TaxID=1529 RepID=A0A1I2JNA3_9CLOT|nr:EutP/PduV family microcompartment system protein [Clostridium cadaveris]MDU4953707.1 EutP/PduV family microcompartment system protein [Clostridium sp.]MDM8312794.1 EutP/PduV family microcompartment system protein [Clostridium cadaveris]MDY4948130.1 EutP/PduV family microcompartment system protein [Clostridium cadaveris]NME65285.1 EutP/PduV family microcompartment system protein [Clostridium cadaveris]UFH66040.1 EutP/PduV family microcompartment system protein [Clostridium cadaveris]
MKRIIFIGKTGSGKTTLCQNLDNLELKYKKTQSVEIYNKSIDTPGEYLENRYYYKALVVTSADADIIALVYDCTNEESYIAPGFASMFMKDVIGIITKIDLAEDESLINRAEKILKEAGVSTIFKVNTLSGEGMKELMSYIEG